MSSWVANLHFDEQILSCATPFCQPNDSCLAWMLHRSNNAKYVHMCSCECRCEMQLLLKAAFSEISEIWCYKHEETNLRAVQSWEKPGDGNCDEPIWLGWNKEFWNLEYFWDQIVYFMHFNLSKNMLCYAFSYFLTNCMDWDKRKLLCK